MNPAVHQRICAEIQEKHARETAALRAELAKHQESEFHPDWSLLAATRDSLAEHQQMIVALREEIAEVLEQNRKCVFAVNEYNAAIKNLVIERNALRERVRVLEDALQDLADTLGECGMTERARAALKESGK